MRYTDDIGRFITKGLFFETTLADWRKRYEVPYTLKERNHTVDGKEYVSLRQIYLSFKDPTEYSFAKDTFGSWEHWKKLRGSSFFKDYYKEWREELEVMLQSEGIKQIYSEAIGDGKSAATAARWLAEKGWEPKEHKGRPSKAKIEQQARQMRRVQDELDDFLDHAESVQH